MKPVRIVLLACAALLTLAGCQPSSLAGTRQAVPPAAMPAGQAATPTAAPAPLPAGWRSYTVATGGYSFACPGDWLVELPTPPDPPVGPSPVRLFAPPARFPGGNLFLVYYSSYAILPGQSLAEWNQQVFLASQDGMIPPRQILQVEELPPVEPGGQALLATHLAGPESGWHRHQVYLAHGGVVLQMWAEVMPEESPQTAQALREIAATIRFLPDAPRRLADVYSPLPGPQLAAVAATATAVASITPSPSCDLTCRDATAWAGVTPGPTLTYPPEMATRERQYLELLSTATAQALTTTPTSSPSATPPPASQPGLVLYKGQSSEGPKWTVQPFQLAYDADEWQLVSEYGMASLSHRQLATCRLEILPGGRGMGGPVVIVRTSLAGLDWRTTYWIYDGAVSYHLQSDQISLWFGLEAGRQATRAHVQACRAAAESVLQTLAIGADTHPGATPGATAAYPVPVLPPETTIPAPEMQPPQALTTTATYTDALIGYALDYPAAWQINAQPGWLASLTSFTPGASGSGGLASGQTKIDLAPDKSGESRTLEQLVAEIKESTDGGPVTVLREEYWELDGGIPAVRIDRQSEPAGRTAALAAVINGRSLRLTGYGDLAWFDTVARTLRPLSPTGQTQSGAPLVALDETATPLARATEAPCPPACTPTPAPPEQPTQDRAAEADPQITSHPKVMALLAALEQRGLSFSLEGPSQAAFLAPIPGAAYAGPTGRLYLHVFPDADAASRRADEIPVELDPQRSLIDWVGEPHFYRCQDVIALYLGRDERTQSALAEYCGPEFAKSK